MTFTDSIHPIKCLKLKTDIIKCCQGCEGTKTLVYCWWTVQSLWKAAWQFLVKLNIYLLYDLALPLLGLYS